MTAIGKRVCSALTLIESRDYESALIMIAIAVDSTAKKKFPKYKKGKYVSKRIEKFISEYTWLILTVAGRGSFIVEKGVNVIFEGQPLEKLISSVRHALIHADELEDHILIAKNDSYLGKNNITTYHIYGLLLSVIADSVNKNEFCPKILNGIPLLELWGNEVRVKKEFLNYE